MNIKGQQSDNLLDKENFIVCPFLKRILNEKMDGKPPIYLRQLSFNDIGKILFSFKTLNLLNEAENIQFKEAFNRWFDLSRLSITEGQAPLINQDILQTHDHKIEIIIKKEPNKNELQNMNHDDEHEEKEIILKKLNKFLTKFSHQHLVESKTRNIIIPEPLDLENRARLYHLKLTKTKIRKTQNLKKQQKFPSRRSPIAIFKLEDPLDCFANHGIQPELYDFCPFNILNNKNLSNLSLDDCQLNLTVYPKMIKSAQSTILKPL